MHPTVDGRNPASGKYPIIIIRLYTYITSFDTFQVVSRISPINSGTLPSLQDRKPHPMH